MAFTGAVLAAVAVAAAVAGTAYSVVSANEAADAQKAQLKDASLTERAAGAQAEAEQRRQLQRVLASQDALRASRGASLTSGTALSIYDDTIETGKRDIAAAKLNNLNRIQQYRYASAAESQRAKDATIGGAISGVGQVAGGASNTYSIYSKK